MTTGMNSGKSRREFIRLGLLAVAGLGLSGCELVFGPGEEPADRDDESPQEVKKPDPVKEDEKPPGKGLIPRRRLGRTGMTVSILGLGGAFTVAQRHLQEEAGSIIDRALDLGVNLIDTAPTYGGSEGNIGAVMRRRRGEAYLASKTLDRTYDGTMRLFEQSLQRLQTDCIDLYQLHGVHTESDWKEATGPGGACRALEELKDGGAVKFTGITAHKNYELLLKALREYDFDCVTPAMNPAECAVDPFLDDVIEEAVRWDLGIIAMKVAAYGRIFRPGGIESMEQALGYALSHPVASAIIGISTLAELEENARLAGSCTPLAPAQMSHLEDLAHPYRHEITFYKQW